MKTKLFIIVLMMSVLSFVSYKSFISYENLDIYGVLAINLVETISILFVVINFMKLIRWDKFNLVYHTRMVLILAFVGVVSLNSLLFSNVLTEYLFIPVILLAFLGFYFIAKQKKFGDNLS
ncbi:MAG: hypothetical protein JW857_06105 [Bacteroidales bacterium]|nr:hypothetical protein [Bacteroidales bacterium]